MTDSVPSTAGVINHKFLESEADVSSILFSVPGEYLVPKLTPSQIETHEETLKSLFIDEIQYTSYWKSNIRESPLSSLFSFEPSAAHTNLEILFNEDFSISGFKEVFISETEGSATNSTSLLRKPGIFEDHHRGSSSHFPFLPGGLDNTPSKLKNSLETILLEDEDLLTTPPGFKHSVSFDRESDTKIIKFHDIFGQEDILNLPALSEEEKEVETTPPEQEPDSNTEKSTNPQEDESAKELEKFLEVKENLHPPIPLEVKGGKEEDVFTSWSITESIDVSNFEALVPEPALNFPFTLDKFQKEAVLHLERGENVFVAAHTSAGKTVVAEYAIALAAKHLTRTVYTSPIKALSNQKFRDFKNTFGDVGLITGDVSLNPESSCLVVTTEVLRSMLYKGADLIRDVEWVIFDEVHYINDFERGVVWEEVIIMLPAHINIILLSATVPNAKEFADWVGRTKKKKVYVIATNKRPVPLEHYVYLNNQFFKIVDSKLNFLAHGYKDARQSIQEKAAKNPNKTAYKGNKGPEKSQWVQLIEHLKKKSLTPAVIFDFSKRKCEENAYSLASVDLTLSSEKSEIHVFMETSLSRLTGTDRELPQVIRIKDLLKRGIGVHHGGLLPIIKEMVELLFSRGLVKLLFATETFAMGVNMPTRTVIFNSIVKHDGNQRRNLLPGEYIQMSGRAGRRGLDSVGTVIVACWNDLPESGQIQTMILGRVTKLESQFRLTYNMILNLLRVVDLKVEDMIKRSFSEADSQRTRPEFLGLLKTSEKKMQAIEPIECIFGTPDIDNFYKHAKTVETAYAQVNSKILQSPKAYDYITGGRVVLVNTKPNSAPAESSKQNNSNCLATVIRTGADSVTLLVIYTEMSVPNPFLPVLVYTRSSTTNLPDYEIKQVEYDDITAISKIKLTKLVQSQIEKKDKDHISQMVQQLQRLAERIFAEGSGWWQEELYHPLHDFKLNDLDFADSYRSYENALRKAKDSKCSDCPKLSMNFAIEEQRANIRKDVENLRLKVSDESLYLMPEFAIRSDILLRLNYIDNTKTVLLKGRVARELTTMREELIGTEMIFENVLTDLEPAEIVSILSCLVFQESNEDVKMDLTPALVAAKKKVTSLADHLALLQIECGLNLNLDDYRHQLKFKLMQVVLEWARGMPFAQICELTDVLEGSIVRCITRLDETCKEVRNAARIIGDTSLFIKMEEASKLIKRDIVFASSLYVAK